MNVMVDQQSLNELALFAGAGGGILGGHLLGWKTVCAVEWEQYPASVLCARQNDGLLPPFPIWDDVQTFDGKPWAGIVDVVSGGFPCTDISSAGKGAGIDGEASGMWREMARIIHEVQPRFVFVENSPILTSRGLGRVLGDLAQMGFDAKWGVLGAGDIGAPHQRDRIWIVGKMAHTSQLFCNGSNDNSGVSLERKAQSQLGNYCWTKELAHTNGISSEIRGNDHANEAISGARNYDIGRGRSNDWGKFDTQKNEEMAYSSLPRLTPCDDKALEPQESLLEKQSWRSGNEFGSTQHWWEAEPNVDRVVDGMASRVDRLKAIGNGQVPLCAATAWRILSE
tara:strand:+ start:90 stop:1106 length:1017 start_codon:yes stop_codon:yes gene_type:complete